MKYRLRDRIKDKQIQVWLSCAKFFARIANYFNDLAEAYITEEMAVMTTEIQKVMKEVDEKEQDSSLH